MKKPVLALAPASVLVLAGSAVAVAATSTSTDVAVLTTAESHVVTLLHQYKATAAWKAQFKSAEAVQVADLAKLNAALAPADPKGLPPNTTVVLRLKGTTTEDTNSFVIPTSQWALGWSTNCESEGLFTYDLYQNGQLDFNDQGPNVLGQSTQAVEHYYDSGTFHLNISAVGCSWSIEVVRSTQ
jgi:hypothetical protein